MAVALVIVAFVVIGAAVVFVAFSGGPRGAREAYLTRGRRTFKVFMVVLYLGLGLAIPVLVVLGRPSAEGATGRLASVHPNKQFEQGKALFRGSCWSCHSLAAIGARGITGPNLDQLGGVTQTRVLNALRIGGTGDGRMPAGILSGQDAQAVAYYVSHVAGK